jgi:hypothetical protein
VVTWPGVLLLGRSYEETDAAAWEQAKYFGAFVPPECRVAALQLICTGSFVECEETNASFTGTIVRLSRLLNLVVVAVRLPCRDLCEDVLTLCGPTAISLGLVTLLPDCNATESLTGGPLFPITDCNSGAPGISAYHKLLQATHIFS